MLGPSNGALRLPVSVVIRSGCCGAWHRFPTAAWFLVLIVSPLHAAPDGKAATRAAQRSPIVSLAFTGDGRSLLIAWQNQVERRELDSNERTAIKTGMPRVAAIATSGAASNLVAIAGGTPGEMGAVIVWDRNRDTHLRIGGFADLATAVTFSPDGALLAIGSGDRTCRLFRLTEKDKAWHADAVGKLVGHGGAVTSMVFSPDGKMIATASVDRSIKVWTVADSALLRTLGNHTDAVNALAVRPQMDPAAPWTIASASDDRTLRIWQPGIGRMVRIVRGHKGPVLAIAYAADGRSLLSLGTEGILRRVDADSDQILEKHSVDGDWCYALAANGDGRHVATGSWGGKADIWRIGNAGLERADDGRFTPP